jgi:energy-coupling factor transporter ATP-binding protein EcfA2
MVHRLPQVLVFGGTEEKPDAAVRTALMGRFNEYINDPTLRGRLAEIEAEIEGRLRIDAKELCEHIQSRCADLGEVTVAPQVSFRHGFVAAPLGIARTSGQPVSLDRSVQGSNRRISLAVWEWTSRLLQQDEAVAAPDALTETGADIPEDAVSLLSPLTQTIVIYDEPDTHLDYGHQRRIMRLIRDQCELTHVNVMVATHSMNLIDGVDIADVVHLRLADGRTVVERLADDAHDAIDGHLGTIAVSVGLRNSVLLHERCFLAVEGASEQQSFPLLFRLAEGIPLQSAGIALWACGGNDGALNLAKYLVEHHRTVVLAIDADSATKKLFKEAHLKDVFGARMNELVEFIGRQTGENELEATFSDRVWARVANKIWPKREEEWSESEFRELRTSGKFSDKVHCLVKENSDSGPGGKASMMAELAAQLTDRADIPDTLLALFSRLRALAD